MFYLRVFKCCTFISRTMSHCAVLQSIQNYDDAIIALNGLISNFHYIKKSSESHSQIRLQNISSTEHYCKIAGIELSDISKLNVIHIAGTKGKGSTCTYIDAILRSKGFKTGLFTSPHLKEVRERIQINGVPISKNYFTEVFWTIYNTLNLNKRFTADMPFYFQFLTILSFHVFLKEKVDYVILETGIGGRFDTTNIIEKPRIACITSIGYDHMEILGNTLSEIAWNKAGIIKTGSLVVTCNSQTTEALDVIKDEVRLKKAKLFLVPALGLKMLEIIQSHCVHSENVLLAAAVCQLLENSFDNFASDDNEEISNMEFESSINECSTFELLLDNSRLRQCKQVIDNTSVAGRYQFIQKGNVEYYIDGAHTIESLKTCIAWFREIALDKKCEKRYLVFMLTGRRSADDLLSELIDINFDGILLTPLIPFHTEKLADFAVDEETINRDKAKLAEVTAAWTRQKLFSKSQHTKESSFECFQSFEDIESWLKSQDGRIQVLVVGSLHLVGCALSVLLP